MTPDEGQAEAIAESAAPATPEVDPTENLEALTQEGGQEEESTQEEVAQPEDPWADFEEVDWDGKQYKVHKELKGSLMTTKDYTQKTQEVADRRKELDAREQQIAQQAQAGEAELEQRTELHSLNKQLKDYQQVDWRQWELQDPIAAGNGFREYQMLKDQRAELSQQLAIAQHQRSEQAKSDNSRRLQETEVHARKIPGWTPEVGKEIKEFAVKAGIPEQSLYENITPVFYDILHKAYIGQQAIEKLNAAPKPPPLKPLAQVGAKSGAPVTRKPEEISDMREYVAARQKQMAAKRR